MKSIFTLLLALTALITVPAPQAQAQAAPQPGHMRAAGVGVVHFKAAGRMEFRLHGKGVLVLRDAASQQIKLTGKGQVHTSTEGDLVIQGFKGKVVVQGQSIQGVFNKGRIGVIADGQGTAKLKGKGLFKVNGIPGTWAKPVGATVSW